MLHRPLIILAFLLCLCAPSALHAQEAPVDFNRDIRPILSDRCFHCHGPDAATRKADLRLDQEDPAKAKVIIPGKPDESEFIRRLIAHDPAVRMPPAESQKPALTEAEVNLFRRWIAEGAPWAQHWAFVKPARTAPPAIPNAAAVRNPIDNFVVATLEAEGLSPSPEAEKATLLRRASLDLIGLPPTLAELDAFLADAAPGAYERAVDRLLASPAYGERMAVDWLDSARFADSNGYQNDFGRDMHPWRDWVIKAFNDNMPYDQFIVEQIAGDMLPNATDTQRVATGFLRNNRSNTEGGSIEDEWRVENIVDRVDTTTTTFMGLTVACARCHDHKYDPISQKEFYEFFAFFNSTEDRGFYEETRGNTGPQVSLPSEEQKQRLAEFDAAIGAIQKKIDSTKELTDEEFNAWRRRTRDMIVPELKFKPDFTSSLSGSLEGTLKNDTALGVIKGAEQPTFTQALLGQGLQFDGAPGVHADFGAPFELDREKPFTMSLWLKPDGGLGAVLSRMDDARNYRGFDLLLNDDGKLSVHMVHRWQENALKISTRDPLPLGVWSHVAVTYDGSSKAVGLRIYIDGEPVNLNTDVDSLTLAIRTDEPLRFGQRSASANFKGAISGFEYFDRALPREEISTAVTVDLIHALREPEDADHLAAIRAHYASYLPHTVAADQAVIDRLAGERNAFNATIPTVMVLKELPEPRPTYLLARGVYDAPVTTEQLYPATPKFLPPLPQGAPNNRLGLAQWLVSPENPLTARVAVNRIWQKFFGRGLVETTENFGLQSEPPTHPELLDWLATYLIDTGWDIKNLQKTIVTSATYRQSSANTPQLLEQDPQNLLLARGPRFRMPAELIRDNALAVSGLLVARIGGPSVKPYQPAGLWDDLAGGAGQGPYIEGTSEDLYRRSLYTFRKRTVPHSTLSTFDAPAFEVCRVRRSTTNTPLQSLALLNDTTYVEAARALAQRMIREAGPDDAARMAHGFRLATGRTPTPREQELLAAGFQNYIAEYASNPGDAAVFTSHGASPTDAALDKTHLAAYTALASVILNLDETITKE